MTVTTAIPAAPPPPTPDRAGMIVLENVSWELYERLLEETEEQHLRITYDSGRMVIKSPLPKHDKVKTLIGRLIEMASLEWMWRFRVSGRRRGGGRMSQRGSRRTSAIT